MPCTPRRITRPASEARPPPRGRVMLSRVIPGAGACDVLHLRRLADAQRPRACRRGAALALPPQAQSRQRLREDAAHPPRKAG